MSSPPPTVHSWAQSHAWPELAMSFADLFDSQTPPRYAHMRIQDTDIYQLYQETTIPVIAPHMDRGIPTISKCYRLSWMSFLIWMHHTWHPFIQYSRHSHLTPHAELYIVLIFLVGLHYQYLRWHTLILLLLISSTIRRTKTTNSNNQRMDRVGPHRRFDSVISHGLFPTGA